MSSGGTELRHRGPKSPAASVSFPPKTLSCCGSRKSDGIRSPVTMTTTTAGRKVRVGLQLPVNYVPKGQGNAYWNKNYSIRVSLDRRARDRRRRLMPRSSPDPAILQQQMMLQHQRQMLVMQAQRAAQGMDSEDEDCGRRVRDKSGMRQKAKAIFAFLMLPSLIVVFNSHKKLHKEESNVDLSALKAGGFGGLGGMGGGGHGAGIPGIPGFGAGAGAGMRPGMGHGMPGMEDREVPGVMSHRHPGMTQHESADEFTRRMMSQYRRPEDEEAMDPRFEDESMGPMDGHGDKMENQTKKEGGDGEAPEELDVENLEAEADVEQESIVDAAEAEMQLPSTTDTVTDKEKDVRLEEKVEPMDDAPDGH